MTKPTSRLEWWPDALNPHTIRALWKGSPWHYTLEWGHLTEDGTPAKDRVPFWHVVPVRHVYPRAGTYTLIGRPELTNATPTSVEVTIRDTVKPDASFELLDDGRSVRATLERLDDGVRYQINWGDHTITFHDVHDLQPAHEYPWGFGAPAITVTDLPARRGARFTGPEIGPEPGPDTPRPEWSFHPTYLPPQHQGSPQSVRGSFHGRNLKPDTWYAVRMSWSTEDSHYARGKSDAQGRVECVIKTDLGWTVQSGQYYGPYRHFTAYEWNDPAGTYTWLPVINRQDGLEPVTAYYSLDTTDPWLIHLTVQSPIHGTYHVDWGDGQAEQVGSDGRVCARSHRYAKTTTGTNITVTAPNGTDTQKITIRPVDLYEPWVRQNSDYWVDFRTTIKHIQGSGPQTPISVDWGFNQHDAKYPWNDGMYPQWAVLGPTGFASIDCQFNNEWRGKTFTAKVHAPFRDPLVRTFTVPEKNTKGIAQRNPNGVVDPPILPDWKPNPAHRDTNLTARFGNVTEWDGGYSGEFTITNHGPDPTPWAIEFTLAGPAVLREVWPSSAQFTELGGGRWRVWSNKPLGDTPAVAGARIEPPGKTRKFPDHITARHWAAPPSAPPASGPDTRQTTSQNIKEET